MSNEETVYPKMYSETVLKVAHGKEELAAPIANLVNRVLTNLNPNIEVYWNDEKIYILIRQYGNDNSDSDAVMMKTDEVLDRLPYTEEYVQAQETIIAESDSSGNMHIRMYRETPQDEFMLMPKLSHSLNDAVNTTFAQRLKKHDVTL